MVHIPWVEPLHKETIEAYALRLSAYITTPNPILVGLSFGGMMAVEIAKHIATQKIILLSSAKGKKEIPFYLRWLGKTGLQHVAPTALVLHPTPITYWFFGLKKQEQKQLLTHILQQSSPTIYKWSVNAILTWQNTTLPQNLYHIHGTADRVLPIGLVQPTHTIKNGGHFMVVSHAPQVAQLLQNIIEN